MNAVDIIGFFLILACGALLGVLGTLTFYSIKDDQEETQNDDH